MKSGSIEIPNDWFTAGPQVSAEARTLHLALLCESNSEGTDGSIDYRRIRIAALQVNITVELAELLQELIDAKVWSAVVSEGVLSSVILNGWENHMKSAADMKALSRKRRKAGRAGARARGDVAPKPQLSREEINAMVNGGIE